MLVLSKNVSTQKIRSERMKPLHYSIPLPNGLIKFPGNIQVLPRKFTSEPLDFWNVVSTWISMNNDSGYIKYGRWICQTSSWFNTSIKECPVRNWFITGPDLNWFKLVLSMLKGYFMVQVWIPWVCVIPYVGTSAVQTQKRLMNPWIVIGVLTIYFIFILCGNLYGAQVSTLCTVQYK